MSSLAWLAEVSDSYASSGLAGRLVPGARPAVVVVDLQRGFTDRSCAAGAGLASVVEATRTLLEEARRARTPIVYTTIAFAAADLDSVLWLQKMPALRELVRGSGWTELDQRLGRLPSEPVLVKQAPSAFSGTRLDGLLRSLMADSLILCGATTSGCVRASAVDACAAGWPCFVPRECVGDRAIGPHEANLLDIDAKYADVIDLPRALTLARGVK